MRRSEASRGAVGLVLRCRVLARQAGTFSLGSYHVGSRVLTGG